MPLPTPEELLELAPPAAALAVLVLTGLLLARGGRVRTASALVAAGAAGAALWAYVRLQGQLPRLPRLLAGEDAPPPRSTGTVVLWVTAAGLAALGATLVPGPRVRVLVGWAARVVLAWLFLRLLLGTHLDATWTEEEGRWWLAGSGAAVLLLLALWDLLEARVAPPAALAVVALGCGALASGALLYETALLAQLLGTLALGLGAAAVLALPLSIRGVPASRPAPLAASVLPPAVAGLALDLHLYAPEPPSLAPLALLAGAPAALAAALLPPLSTLRPARRLAAALLLAAVLVGLASWLLWEGRPPEAGPGLDDLYRPR